MGRPLGQSSITLADLAKSLNAAAEEFVIMAGKFQVATRHFTCIAELVGAEDD